MQPLQLIKDYNYKYTVRDNTFVEEAHWILYNFLFCEMSSPYDYYINLAYDPSFYGGIGNAICIEKEDGYMYLSDGIFLPEEGQESIKLKMTIDQYIYLANTFVTKVFAKDKLKRPSEITIHYDNEKFSFDIKE